MLRDLSFCYFGTGLYDIIYPPNNHFLELMYKLILCIDCRQLNIKTFRELYDNLLFSRNEFVEDVVSVLQESYPENVINLVELYNEIYNLYS